MNTINRLASLLTLGLFAQLTWATPVNLGSAGHFTLLGAGEGSSSVSGQMQLGSEAQIYGNVGGRGYVDLATNVTIHGDIYGGTINYGVGASVTGQEHVLGNADWDDIYSDLVAASNAALAISGNSVSTINSTTLFDASSANAIHINGDIDLSSGETLTIQGGSNDQIVINVSNRLFLGSGAAIILQGGITADNVIFNFFGGQSDVAYNNHLATIVGGAEFSGTYIAPKIWWQIGDGAIMNSTRVLVGGLQGNLQTVHAPVTNIPEPGLFVIFLFALVLVKRKF